MPNPVKATVIDCLTRPPVSWLGNRYVGDHIPVFMLHRFRSEQNPKRGHKPAFVRECLEWLRKRNIQTLSLDDATELLQSDEAIPPSVVFTIDDGYEDNLSVGGEIFLEYDIPATVFLLSGLLDRTLWPWDDRLAYAMLRSKRTELPLAQICSKATSSTETSGFVAESLPLNNGQRLQSFHSLHDIITRFDGEQFDAVFAAILDYLAVDIPEHAPDDYRPLDWESARQMQSRGIRFGVHTVSHRILSQLDTDRARAEITDCRDRLVAESLNPSKVFCYPTGKKEHFGPRDQALVKELGFDAAVTTEHFSFDREYFNADPMNRFALPRYAFPNTLEDFKQYASWLEQGKRKFRSGRQTGAQPA